MTKCSSPFQRDILCITLICLVLLRPCSTRNSFYDLDLSSQTLNPVVTGFMMTGNAANNYFGAPASTAGDINNDGYDDIIVGAYSKNNYQGAAYVIYGGEESSFLNIDLSTTSLSPLTTGFMITGNAVGDRLGYPVSTAGDLNNDGYDDIIVGAYQKNNKRGAAYVIYGGPKSTMSNWDFSSGVTLNPSTTGFIVTGNTINDQLGGSASTAGDINKDGYDDIIVGARGKNSNQGAAYVIYGGPKSAMSNIILSSTTLSPASTGFTITGNAAGDNFGASVSTAGDVNHDGYNDILIGAHQKNNNQGAAYVIYDSCSKNCKQCISASICTVCKNSFLFYQYECFDSCPTATFTSTDTCRDCPSYCSSCDSQNSCQVCFQGYTLSNSLCVLSRAQEKALKAISSATQGIGSIVCVGSAIFPFSALVSKIVQNTRYLNLSVTNDLAEVYQTWQTDLISWDVPNVMSDLDHFKTTPILFAQYDLGSPFLVNFWPTLINVAIGFGTFISCLMLRKLFEHAKYEGWAYSLVRKLVAGSFNFALVQAYACLDDILFYLVLDAKTNPFNSFFSWTSMISAVIFLGLGGLQVFFNFWTVIKYQRIKQQGKKDLIEAFNERNKYWELFYSDFNDEDLWSQSFFAIAIIRSTLSSFIITVLYDYPLMQASYLVILDIALISFLYFKSPFNTLRGKLAQYYYETITLLVHLCTFILGFQDSSKNPSDTVKLIMSTGILYLNTALVSGAIGFMFIEIYKTISQKTRAGKLKQYESVAVQTAAKDIFTTNQDQDLKTLDSYQQSSYENLHLLSGNTNLLGLNLESSQILESNFNVGNSRELEMDQINMTRDQNTTQIFLRTKLRILKPKQKGNSQAIQ